MPDWRKLKPHKFLKTPDLEGEPHVVTIDKVGLAKMPDSGEQELTVQFKEFEQAMILNQTNGSALAALFGHETGDWYGQQVELYPTTCQYKGEEVPCMRIRQRMKPVKVDHAEADKAFA